MMFGKWRNLCSGHEESITSTKMRKTRVLVPLLNMASSSPEDTITSNSYVGSCITMRMCQPSQEKDVDAKDASCVFQKKLLQIYFFATFLRKWRARLPAGSSRGCGTGEVHSLHRLAMRRPRCGMSSVLMLLLSAFGVQSVVSHIPQNSLTRRILH